MPELSIEGSSRQQADRATNLQPIENLTPSRSLALRIQRTIRRLAPGGVRNLEVEVTQGQIILTGSCQTFYCKQVSQHTAMELSEGEQVVNRIEVVARG